jgi:hypothetical protein
LAISYRADTVPHGSAIVVDSTDEIASASGIAAFMPAGIGLSFVNAFPCIQLPQDVPRFNFPTVVAELTGRAER